MRAHFCGHLFGLKIILAKHFHFIVPENEKCLIISSAAATKAASMDSQMTLNFAAIISYSMYSMPQRVGLASLGNLEELHQKANGSTIVFTHCEQKNEIT